MKAKLLIPTTYAWNQAIENMLRRGDITLSQYAETMRRLKMIE